ncbi:MAG: hypothetical protein K2L08_02660 [Erysipelotrichaceae bacterium]|nr:hypothetical protein [Erysipelotrichaceae bacterium]
MKLWKCRICGYIHEGEEAPSVCPKCHSSAENFALMSNEEAEKVYRSDKSNDYHMQLVQLAMKMDKIASRGIADNLDPACVAIFQKTKQYAWEIKQLAKAELAGHMTKGKY